MTTPFTIDANDAELIQDRAEFGEPEPAEQADLRTAFDYAVYMSNCLAEGLEQVDSIFEQYEELT